MERERERNRKGISLKRKSVRAKGRAAVTEHPCWRHVAGVKCDQSLAYKKNELKRKLVFPGH